MPSICRQPNFGALRDQASDVILTGIPEQRSAKTRDRRTSDQPESESIIKFFKCSPLRESTYKPSDGAQFIAKRKLAEEARNQETEAVKSYGGFGTFA